MPPVYNEGAPKRRSDDRWSTFTKNTRLEYMRHLDQKRWYGKLGFTPWRWRVYLEPPQVPQKVRTAVLAKLEKVWARRAKELAPAKAAVRTRK